MQNPPRKTAFVVAASEHGTMIVNRLDYRLAVHEMDKTLTHVKAP